MKARWLRVLVIALVYFSMLMPPAHAAGGGFPRKFEPIPASGGVSVWKSPGPVVSPVVDAHVKREWSTKVGEVTVKESGPVLLEKIVDNSKGAMLLAQVAEVTIATQRTISAADLLAASKSLLGLSGWGLVLNIASQLPAMVQWVQADGGKNIRMAPSGKGFEKKEENKEEFPISTGYEYYAGFNTPWFPTKEKACIAIAPLIHPQIGVGQRTFTFKDIVNGSICRFTFVYDDGETYHAQAGSVVSRGSDCPVGWYITPQGCLQNPQQEDWLPASMDDIAPYLKKYAPPVELPVQLIDKGQAISATEKSVTGPDTSIIDVPSVIIEDVPVPPPSIAKRNLSGNPYNLPDSQPTVISQSTGSTPVQTSTQTVNAPNTTTTTATYNPTTKQTETVTETKHDDVKTETKSENTTNITYTTTTATATTTNKTTTTVINNTTNTVINNTTTTSTPKNPLPDDKATDTPLGPIPKLYERKYPNGIKGVWDEKSKLLKESSIMTLAKQLMPMDYAGGQCPSWMLPLDLAEWAPYGTADISPPCWLWDVAKAIVLLSAAMLARALIFGG